MIEFDFKTYMKDFPEVQDYKQKLKDIKYKLENDTTMLDWYDIDKCTSQSQIKDIIETSKYIRENCEVFIVIGIGGSFLGSKAVISSLAPYFQKKNPQIIFAGTSLSAEHLNDLIEYIKDKEVIVNVISKSGTTLEVDIAFNIIYEQMKQKYNEEELEKRIIITTDKHQGNLRKLVSEKGYKSFTVPNQIGGRYSVLTPVGLLPIAVCGYDIKKLLKGARESNENQAMVYAMIRDILYKEGKKVESFTVYEPRLTYFTQWLQQLFAETQGKEKKGILPISAINTRDLHSLGQYYQDGERILFETVISITKSSTIKIAEYDKALGEINNIAAHQVAKAHQHDGVYSNFIIVEEWNEYTLGYLIYFFEVAAAVGAYLLELNPFDQPGVNDYKELIDKELRRSI